MTTPVRHTPTAVGALPQSARVCRILDARGTETTSYETAKQLGISTKTLRRRLSAEGHHFYGLVDDARLKYCIKEIKKGEPCAKRIAPALGFTELNSFYRACHRWTGLSWTELKRVHA